MTKAWLLFPLILRFFLTKGLSLETLELAFRIYRQYTNLLYFNLYFNTAYMYAAHYVHSTNYYLVILKIIFGIYTRSQQMKRKFECQKDISQSVERSVAQLVQRWSRDPASRVQRCDVTLSNATS